MRSTLATAMSTRQQYFWIVLKHINHWFSLYHRKSNLCDIRERVIRLSRSLCALWTLWPWRLLVVAAVAVARTRWRLFVCRLLLWYDVSPTCSCAPCSPCLTSSSCVGSVPGVSPPWSRCQYLWIGKAMYTLHPQFYSSTLHCIGVGCSDTKTHTAAEPH